MNKHNLIDTLIAIIALGFASGLLQPITHSPMPEPVPHQLCVPLPPSVPLPGGVVLWI